MASLVKILVGVVIVFTAVAASLILIVGFLYVLS